MYGNIVGDMNEYIVIFPNATFKITNFWLRPISANPLDLISVCKVYDY